MSRDIWDLFVGSNCMSVKLRFTREVGRVKYRKSCYKTLLVSNESRWFKYVSMTDKVLSCLHSLTILATKVSGPPRHKLVV